MQNFANKSFFFEKSTKKQKAMKRKNTSCTKMHEKFIEHKTEYH